jgi:hypothetical protein
MHGARAALFGRKINNSEDQLTFVRFLHAIAGGSIDAAEAVRAYHGELQKLGLKPYRALKDDLELTVTATSYSGTGTTVSLAGSGAAKPQAVVKTAVIPGPSRLAAPAPAASTTRRSAGPKMDGFPTRSDGSVDFSKMNGAQKVAYARQRIKNDLVRADASNGRS